METPYEFGAEAERLVYVKTVAVADLPSNLQEQAEGREQLYAVHAETGEQLALVSDRNAAFSLARQNDYQPVAVH